MDGRSLTELADEQLRRARSSSSGRSAVTVFGGREHDLRQPLIALAEDNSLGEHDSPGDYVIIPPSRHDLHADTDAVVLLTVATRA